MSWLVIGWAAFVGSILLGSVAGRFLRSRQPGFWCCCEGCRDKGHVSGLQCKVCDGSGEVLK